MTTDKNLVRLSIISVAVFAGLLFVCLIVCIAFALNQPGGLAGVQMALVLVHQIAGAAISAVGIALLLSHYSGKLPFFSFGRSLLLLMIGLAVFSLTPLFGVAAVAIYVADTLRPELKHEELGTTDEHK